MTPMSENNKLTNEKDCHLQGKQRTGESPVSRFAKSRVPVPEEGCFGDVENDSDNIAATVPPNSNKTSDTSGVLSATEVSPPRKIGDAPKNRDDHSNPKRGRAMGPAGSGRTQKSKFCSFCITHNPNAVNHLLWHCEKAPLCTRCNCRGHEATSCKTRDPISSSLNSLNRKEKLERQAKYKNKKKRQMDVELGQYEGENAAAAISMAPVIEQTPNTLSSKIGYEDPLLVTPDILSVEESEEEVIINIQQKKMDRTKNEMKEQLIHFHRRETKLSILQPLPSFKALCLLTLGYAFKLLTEAIITELFHPIIHYLFSAVFLIFTLHNIYSNMFVTVNLVLKMESEYIEEGDLDGDYRTDVQKISDLKHEKPHIHKATFSWNYARADSLITETCNLRSTYVRKPDGTTSKIQDLWLFFGFKLVPAPPLPMYYSGEAATQFMGPNIVDLIGNEEETKTRINYTLRNMGSVANDRYTALSHIRLISDAAIASVIISSDEKWRKNALSLN